MVPGTARETGRTGQETRTQEEAYHSKKVNALFLIGAGPSMGELDYSRIAEFTTMTVNYAAMAINEGFDPERPELFNWGRAKYHPDYAHWRDAQMGQHMKGYQGIAVVPCGALNVQAYPPPDVQMEVYNRHEIMEIVGSTSGTSALHAAVRMGFNPIFLIGYDYYETKAGMYGYGSHVSNWNTENMDDYGDNEKWLVYESSLSGIRNVKQQMIDPNGVEVFNLNKDSMLGEFPYLSLDEAMEML